MIKNRRKIVPSSTSRKILKINHVQWKTYKNHRVNSKFKQSCYFFLRISSCNQWMYCDTRAFLCFAVFFQSLVYNLIRSKFIFRFENGIMHVYRITKIFWFIVLVCIQSIKSPERNFHIQFLSTLDCDILYWIAFINVSIFITPLKKKKT